MVKHLSDDQLKKLTLGGHDPIKVYNAYKAAVEHKGAPTVDPGAHDQGLRPRRSGRRQEHHPPAEEAERRGAARVPHPLRHSDLGRRDRTRRRSTGRPTTAPRSGTCASGARRSAAIVPSRERAIAAARAACRTTLFEEFSQGHRGPQGLDDDGVRAAAVEAAARQGARPARRADRARRGAHLRHGGALPPGRHLLARRPALRAGRHGHAPLLQGSDGRADSRRRHHRSRVDVVVHRRRHGVRDARRQHDSRSSSTTRCSASSASAT